MIAWGWAAPALALASTPAGAEWQFQPLGDLSAAPFRSEASKVSPDGSSIVGFGTSTSSGSNAMQAFVWNDPEEILELGFLAGGSNSEAFDVSTAGAFVVGASNSTATGSNSTEAFLWEAATDTTTPLGFLPGGQNRSVAYGITPDGSVIVGSSVSGNTGSGFDEAFRKTEEGMIGLGFLPNAAFNSVAFGVSDDGKQVVGAAASALSGSNSTEAFVWDATHQQMTALGDLPGGSFFSRANAISGDGQVIVGGASSTRSGAGRLEAVRWISDGEPALLSPLAAGSNSSEALDANRDGSRIVGTMELSFSDTAFLWDAESGMMRAMVDILEADGEDLHGWRLTSATGISADGNVISGVAINPESNEEAWRAIFIPEPEAFALQLASLLALTLLARARRGAYAASCH
jgi:uncharacterized membrane protein